MRTWLVDTGPLVALLGASDPAHRQVAEVFVSLRGRLITTAAVLTEAFYLLRSAPTGAERLVDFIEESGIEVLEVFAVEHLRRIVVLMARYSDQPMDFADATLVLIAEERTHDGILTLDERGFRAYRYRGNRRFHLLVQDN